MLTVLEKWQRTWKLFFLSETWKDIIFEERVLLLKPVQWNIKIQILAFAVDKLEKINNKIQSLKYRFHIRGNHCSFWLYIFQTYFYAYILVYIQLVNISIYYTHILCIYTVYILYIVYIYVIYTYI